MIHATVDTISMHAHSTSFVVQSELLLFIDLKRKDIHSGICSVILGLILINF